MELDSGDRFPVCTSDRTANPLGTVDGAALRSQSEWLLAFADTSHYRSLNAAGKEAVDGLINLLDEIRSYCHDEHGIDCLLQEDDTDGSPCPTCSNPRGCGA